MTPGDENVQPNDFWNPNQSQWMPIPEKSKDYQIAELKDTVSRLEYRLHRAYDLIDTLVSKVCE